MNKFAPDVATSKDRLQILERLIPLTMSVILCSDGKPFQIRLNNFGKILLKVHNFPCLKPPIDKGSWGRALYFYR